MEKPGTVLRAWLFRVQSVHNCGVGRDFLAIDFETASYGDDSACSIGLVQVRDGRIVRQQSYLIRPPSREFKFTHIHGLSWKDVEHARTFGELWPEIEPFFEGAAFIAAHNASFDRRILNGCCRRFGLRAPELEYTCSMQLARKTWEIRPTRLSDVCRHLGIPLKHHEALSDAVACARIVLAASQPVVSLHLTERPEARTVSLHD